MEKEIFLQYIWQHKLFYAHNQRTTAGQPVEVIDVGRLNTNAGPDFFNAKIKIDGHLWAGNVEIHKNASDWERHGHTTDEAYQNVILHVVRCADKEILRPNGEPIPQLVLTFPPQTEESYHTLCQQQVPSLCAEQIKSMPEFLFNAWKNALLTERLMHKTDHLNDILNQNKNNWSEAFYVSLARSFGFGINSDAFERLAQSVPLTYIQKHKNNLVQIEALFFGQSGLLPQEPLDEYTLHLKKEYDFLKAKFSLTAPTHLPWKMARLRPQNFPQVRIAQFANLVHLSSKISSKIIENPDYDAISKLFSGIGTSEYWNTHCTFDKPSPNKPKHLGKSAINTLIINTIVPFLFCYCKRTDSADAMERTFAILEQIPAEQNAVITGWENIGIKVSNAFDSQALLELRREYCEKKNCLRCRIGHGIIGRK